MAKGTEGQGNDAGDVDDGKVLGSKSKCAHTNSLFWRNITRGARSKSDCLINGSCDWERLFCRVRGARGGWRDIDAKHCVTSFLLIVIWEQSEPQEKLEVKAPVDTGKSTPSGAVPFGTP
jgi:hypothetical protein